MFNTTRKRGVTTINTIEEMKKVLTALLLVLCWITVVYSARLLLTGVNEAGAEFGSPGGGPVNQNYVYPDLSASQHLHSLGMNIFRLPFLWERLQPTLNAAFNTAELGYLTNTVNNYTGSGSYVLLDPHNYAKYNGNYIGGGSVSFASFASFWGQLADTFKDNSRVLFGLMNEPSGGITTEAWLQAANAAIAAIRQTGAKNLIFVPGNGYTGAHWWTTGGYGTPNSQVMTNISDPLNYFVFEVHQYFDSDYSGSSSSCQSATIGAEKMAAFTAWCRANGYKGFVGEFAGGDNTVCQQCITNFLSYLEDNSDVYLGWTWWSAGPWWGGYMYSVEPTQSNGQWTDKPQTSWLTPYFAGADTKLNSNPGSTGSDSGFNFFPTSSSVTLSSWMNFFISS